MAFNQQTLQGFLSLAFGINSSFVVPKQGTWYNPQAQASDGSKPDTWCAYRIVSSSAWSLPFGVDQPSGAGVLKTSINTAIVEIQLVGEYAEQAVQSMQFWNERNSVTSYASNNGFATFYGSSGGYTVSTFVQEGVNTVLAYNARFKVQWNNQWAGTTEILTTVNAPSGYANGVDIVN